MRLSCLIFVLCVTPVIALAEPATEPITPVEAIKKVNEKVTVRMEIKSTGGRGNRYLNSEADFMDPKNFFLFISKDDLEKFKKAGIEKPEDHYKGKIVEATGKVEVIKEKAQIKIEEPGQIKVIEKEKK